MKHLIDLYIYISLQISRLSPTNKHRFVLKCIASLIVACFTAQQFAYAAPGIANTSTSNIPQVIAPLQLSIPQSIAAIDEVYQADADKTIILIQDAHTNESGQMHIAQSLDVILSEHDIPYVFLEAGQGDLSLSYLRQSASLKKRQSVAKDYLKKGLLQGSEYFDLTTEQAFTLWGVENMRLYEEGLQVYADVVEARADNVVHLDQIKSTLDFLKQKIFNKRLLAYNRDRTAYQQEKMSLSEYFLKLVKTAEQMNISLSKHKDLKLWLKLYKLESNINFDQANQELAQALEIISSQDEQEAKDLDQLNTTKPFNVSNSALNPMEGYFELFQKYMHQYISKSDLKRDYTQITKYLTYLKASSKLDAKEVLEQLNAFEHLMLQALSKNAQEITLFNLAEQLNIITKLIQLTISPEEYQSLTLALPAKPIQTITAELNEFILELKSDQNKALFYEAGLETLIQKALEFYALTYERDKAFLQSMNQKLEEEGLDKGILITGGYHATHLKALFKQNNISFISITPNILHETNHSRYEKMLLAQLKSNKNQGRKSIHTLNTMSLKPVKAGGELTTSRLARALNPNSINKVIENIASRSRMSQRFEFEKKDLAGLFNAVNALLDNAARTQEDLDTAFNMIGLSGPPKLRVAMQDSLEAFHSDDIEKFLRPDKGELDKKVEILDIIYGLALFVMDRNRKGELLSPDEVEGLNTIINKYNKLLTTKNALSLSSLFAGALKPYYSNNDTFVKYSHTLKRLPGEYKYRAVAYSLYLHAVHMSSTIRDTEHDYLIVEKNLQFLFQAIKSPKIEISPDTLSMIRAGIVRISIYMSHYLSEFKISNSAPFGGKSGKRELIILNPRHNNLAFLKSIQELLSNNMDFIRLGYERYYPKGGGKDSLLLGWATILMRNGILSYESYLFNNYHKNYGTYKTALDEQLLLIGGDALLKLDVKADEYDAIIDQAEDSGADIADIIKGKGRDAMNFYIYNWTYFKSREIAARQNFEQWLAQPSWAEFSAVRMAADGDAVVKWIADPHRRKLMMGLGLVFVGLPLIGGLVWLWSYLNRPSTEELLQAGIASGDIQDIPEYYQAITKEKKVELLSRLNENQKTILLAALLSNRFGKRGVEEWKTQISKWIAPFDWQNDDGLLNAFILDEHLMSIHVAEDYILFTMIMHFRKVSEAVQGTDSIDFNRGQNIIETIGESVIQHYARLNPSEYRSRGQGLLSESLLRRLISKIESNPKKQELRQKTFEYVAKINQLRLKKQLNSRMTTESDISLYLDEFNSLLSQRSYVVSHFVKGIKDTGVENFKAGVIAQLRKLKQDHKDHSWPINTAKNISLSSGLKSLIQSKNMSTYSHLYTLQTFVPELIDESIDSIQAEFRFLKDDTTLQWLEHLSETYFDVLLMTLLMVIIEQSYLNNTLSDDLPRIESLLEQLQLEDKRIQWTGDPLWILLTSISGVASNNDYLSHLERIRALPDELRLRMHYMDAIHHSSHLRSVNHYLHTFHFGPIPQRYLVRNVFVKIFGRRALYRFVHYFPWVMKFIMGVDAQAVSEHILEKNVPDYLYLVEDLRVLLETYDALLSGTVKSDDIPLTQNQIEEAILLAIAAHSDIMLDPEGGFNVLNRLIDQYKKSGYVDEAAKLSVSLRKYHELLRKHLPRFKKAHVKNKPRPWAFNALGRYHSFLYDYFIHLTRQGIKRHNSIGVPVDQSFFSTGSWLKNRRLTQFLNNDGKPFISSSIDYSTYWTKFQATGYSYSLARRVHNDMAKNLNRFRESMFAPPRMALRTTDIANARVVLEGLFAHSEVGRQVTENIMDIIKSEAHFELGIENIWHYFGSERNPWPEKNSFVTIVTWSDGVEPKFTLIKVFPKGLTDKPIIGDIAITHVDMMTGVLPAVEFLGDTSKYEENYGLHKPLLFMVQDNQMYWYDPITSKGYQLDGDNTLPEVVRKKWNETKRILTKTDDGYEFKIISIDPRGKEISTILDSRSLMEVESNARMAQNEDQILKTLDQLHADTLLAAKGTPALELVKFFEFSGASHKVSSQILDDGAYAVRVQMHADDKRFSLSDVLVKELAGMSQYDLIYNRRNQLIAIIPVLSRRAAVYKQYHYFDLSEYYVSNDLLNSFTQSNKSGWVEHLNLSNRNRRIIRDYIIASRPTKFKLSKKWSRRDQVPFVYVEIHLETGLLRLIPFYPQDLLNEELAIDLNGVFEPILSNREGYERIVLPVFPTVYSPSRYLMDDFELVTNDKYILSDTGLIMNQRRTTKRTVSRRRNVGIQIMPRDDTSLVGYVYKDIQRQTLENEDNLIDDTTGSGYWLWMMWVAANKRKDLNYHARDINPLAVANARATASLAGIKAEIEEYDGSTLREIESGNDDSQYRIIVTNGPAYNPKHNPERLERHHDGTDFYLDYIAGLPGRLKSNGIAYLWHQTMQKFETYNDDPVFDELRDSGLQTEIGYSNRLLSKRMEYIYTARHKPTSQPTRLTGRRTAVARMAGGETEKVVLSDESLPKGVLKRVLRFAGVEEDDVALIEVDDRGATSELTIDSMSVTHHVRIIGIIDHEGIKKEVVLKNPIRRNLASTWIPHPIAWIKNLLHTLEIYKREYKALRVANILDVTAPWSQIYFHRLWPYLLMNRAEGDALKDKQLPSEQVARDFFELFGKKLKKMHENGVTHNDLTIPRETGMVLNGRHIFWTLIPAVDKESKERLQIQFIDFNRSGTITPKDEVDRIVLAIRQESEFETHYKIKREDALNAFASGYLGYEINLNAYTQDTLSGAAAGFNESVESAQEDTEETDIHSSLMRFKDWFVGFVVAWVGTAGIIFSFPVVLTYLSIDRAPILPFGLMFVEVWLLASAAFLVTKYFNSFIAHLAWMMAAVSVSFIAFHAWQAIVEGDVASISKAIDDLMDVARRWKTSIAVAFSSAFIVKMFKKDQDTTWFKHLFSLKTYKENIPYGLRWAIIPSIVNGYIINFLWLPFLHKYFNHINTRVMFDLTFGAALLSLPVIIFMGNLFGEGSRSDGDDNIFRSSYQSWKSLYAKTFFTWGPILSLTWRLSEGHVDTLVQFNGIAAFFFSMLIVSSVSKSHENKPVPRMAKKADSLDEIHSRLQHHYQKQLQFGRQSNNQLLINTNIYMLEANESVKNLVNDLIERGVRELLVVGLGMPTLPYYWASLGRKVVVVDMNKRQINLFKAHWTILDGAMQKSNGSKPITNKIRTAYGVFGDIDLLQNQHLKDKKFGAITFAGLMGRVPIGSPTQWMQTASSLLKSTGYLLLDDSHPNSAFGNQSYQQTIMLPATQSVYMGVERATDVTYADFYNVKAQRGAVNSLYKVVNPQPSTINDLHQGLGEIETQSAVIQHRASIAQMKELLGTTTRLHPEQLKKILTLPTINHYAQLLLQVQIPSRDDEFVKRLLEEIMPAKEVRPELLSQLTMDISEFNQQRLQHQVNPDPDIWLHNQSSRMTDHQDALWEEVVRDWEGVEHGPMDVFSFMELEDGGFDKVSFVGETFHLPMEFIWDNLPEDDQGTPVVHNPFKLNGSLRAELMFRAFANSRGFELGFGLGNPVDARLKELYPENYTTFPDGQSNSILDNKIQVLLNKRQWLKSNQDFASDAGAGIYEFNVAKEMNALHSNEPDGETKSTLPELLSSGNIPTKLLQDLGVKWLWPMGAKERDDVAHYFATKAGKQGQSPYALKSNRADPQWGGPKAYAQFIEDARRLGFEGVVGDFVSNHYGFVSDMVIDHPELFIIVGQNDERVINNPTDWFIYNQEEENTKVPTPEVLKGSAILKARDENGVLGTGDVAQISLHHEKSWDALISIIEDAADQVCGAGGPCALRVDLAHFLWRNNLKDRVWHFLTEEQRAQFDAHYAGLEFWEVASIRLKEKYPHLTLIAEVYGGLGSSVDLMARGFDIAYDKDEGFYDKVLKHRDIDGLNVMLRQQAMYQKAGFRFLKFLENHDEPSATSMLPSRLKHAQALFLQNLIGGPRLMYRGEENGRFTPKNDAEDALPKDNEANRSQSDSWRRQIYAHLILNSKVFRKATRRPLAVHGFNNTGAVAAYDLEYEGRHYIGVVNSSHLESGGDVQLNLSQFLPPTNAKRLFVLRDIAQSFIQGVNKNSFDVSSQMDATYIRTPTELEHLHVHLQGHEFHLFEVEIIESVVEDGKPHNIEDYATLVSLRRDIERNGIPYDELQKKLKDGREGGEDYQRNRQSVWWKDPQENHAVVSLPISALRRDTELDMGIGKFTDLAMYYRNELQPRGIDTILLLPYFAKVQQSPYEPGTLWALEEAYVDWSLVPEVNRHEDLLNGLIVPAEKQRRVDYDYVVEREKQIASLAYQHFKNDPERVQSMAVFYATNNDLDRGLQEYAEFKAYQALLNKTSLEWTQADLDRLKSTEGFEYWTQVYRYIQWIAHTQFKQAVEDLHLAGAKVMGDEPRFRAKDGADVFHHADYFSRVKPEFNQETGELIHPALAPGVRDGENTYEWSGLALPLSSQWRENEYLMDIKPLRHQLEYFNLDGMRLDAMNFLFWVNHYLGLDPDNPPPGGDAVRHYASLFEDFGGLALAEAMDETDKSIRSFNIPTALHHWDNPNPREGWLEIGNHDFHRNFPSADTLAEDLKVNSERLLTETQFMARFIALGLPDIWGGPYPIQFYSTDEYGNGTSAWDYRIPLPIDDDYADRVRITTEETLAAINSARMTQLKPADVGTRMAPLYEMVFAGEYEDLEFRFEAMIDLLEPGVALGVDLPTYSFDSQTISEPFVREGRNLVFNGKKLEELTEADLKYVFWTAFGPIYEKANISFFDLTIDALGMREVYAMRIIGRGSSFFDPQKQIFKAMGLNNFFAGHSVLHVGSSIGNVALAIAELGATQVVGLDGSKVANEAAQILAISTELDTKAHFIEATFLDLSRQDIPGQGTFDIAYMERDTLKYIPMPLRAEFLESIASKLNPNGHILINYGREDVSGLSPLLDWRSDTLLFERTYSDDHDKTAVLLKRRTEEEVGRSDAKQVKVEEPIPAVGDEYQKLNRMTGEPLDQFVKIRGIRQKSDTGELEIQLDDNLAWLSIKRLKANYLAVRMAATEGARLAPDVQVGVIEGALNADWIESDRESKAIFVLGLWEVFRDRFDGVHALALRAGLVFPALTIGDDGEEVLHLGGFSVRKSEAESIRQKYRHDQKILRAKFVEGSVLSYRMQRLAAERDYIRDLEWVDSSGQKRLEERAVYIHPALLEQITDIDVMEFQLRNLVLSLKAIRKIAPTTTFYLGDVQGQQRYELLSILEEYHAQSYILLEEPKGKYIVTLSPPDTAKGAGSHMDIPAINQNELAEWSEPIYQGLLESIALTDSDTQKLVFDPTYNVFILDRLLTRRNGYISQKISNRIHYINLLSNIAKAEQRIIHQWPIIQAVPMQLILQALQRTIQQMGQAA